MQILPVPYEIASSVLIILGLSLTLHGVFGSYLAYKHRIPIDLALTTLCCIPLLLLCWGAPAQHKGLPLTLAVLVNIVPSIWYTNSNTRERSGTFR